ncbi:unnamed protein product [Natator depressus]
MILGKGDIRYLKGQQPVVPTGWPQGNELEDCHAFGKRGVSTDNTLQPVTFCPQETCLRPNKVPSNGPSRQAPGVGIPMAVPTQVLQLLLGLMDYKILFQTD